MREGAPGFRAILAHELGHCYLGLGHERGFLSMLMGKSLMSPVLVVKSDRIFDRKKDDYYRELFEPSKIGHWCTPFWLIPTLELD